MNYTYPNYNKNIINISSSFNKMLGNETNVKTLKILDNYLQKNYKNVVFLILDGCGIHPIKVNTDKNNVLRKNIKQVLTSTFPSTTTNATTTMMSCTYPSTHGWLGWSLYFEELNKAVDIYLDKDSYSEEKIDNKFVYDRIPFNAYYENNINYTVNTVFPSYFKKGLSENNYTYEDTNDLFKGIENCLKKEGKQFVYSYCGDPDYTMHRFGVTSKEAKDVINHLSKLVNDLTSKYEDTLFVITADHGHVDIDGYIEIYKDKELLDLLEWPLFLEPRATGFKIKKGKEKQFEKLFKQHYSKDFKLYKTNHLINKGIFGPKTDNLKLLGDYIANCKTNKQFLFSENSTHFKGHHTSLGKEMLVPLIIIEGKATNLS